MRTVAECRSCLSTYLTELIDLGEHHLSDFRKDESKPPKSPLVVVVCDKCKLVQLRHSATPSDMYHENYGFKSGISDSIKKDLKDVVSTALEYATAPRSWLDIASNDGTLLSYVPSSMYREGFDPIEKYCAEAEQYADTIVCDFFSAEKTRGRFDIITSISCFYDMDDPNKFVSDVAEVMDDKAVWVIQQNYLMTTMQLKAIDNFCAEHLTYYSLLSLEPLLERHGLEVIDVSTSMVNGGSLRTIVAKEGMYDIQPNVQRQREAEASFGLENHAPYVTFAQQCLMNIINLKELIDDLNSRNASIFILAASTRGSTIWQAAGITVKDTPFAIERNPEKVGRYFSAIGVPIISEEEARAKKPTHMLVGPWFFFPEIREREKEFVQNGGHFIVPLPKVRIV